MNNTQLNINQLAQNAIITNEKLPTEIGDKRSFTSTEQVVLTQEEDVIEASKKAIASCEEDLKTIEKQSDLITTNLQKELDNHKEANTAFVGQLSSLEPQIEQLKKRITMLKNTSTPVASPKPTQKGSRSNLGLWLIFAGLALDIIAIVATWSTQRIAFGVDVIIERITYVLLGIFGLSILLHFLYKKTGNKMAVVGVCVGLFMSLTVAAHVIIVTSMASTETAVAEFDLNLIESATEPAATATTNGLMSLLINKPGLAEFFVMAFCFVVVLISIFVISITNKAEASNKTSSTQPETAIQCVIPILESQLNNLELQRQAVVKKQAEEDVKFAELCNGYNERLGTLKIEFKEKVEQIEQHEKTIKAAINHELQVLSVLRTTILTMMSLIQPEATFVYTPASEENVKAHYGIK
jgi:hypothetical protein